MGLLNRIYEEKTGHVNMLSKSHCKIIQPSRLHLSVPCTAFVTACNKPQKLYNNGKDCLVKDDQVKTYLLHSLLWNTLTKFHHLVYIAQFLSSSRHLKPDCDSPTLPFNIIIPPPPLYKHSCDQMKNRIR